LKNKRYYSFYGFSSEIALGTFKLWTCYKTTYRFICFAYNTLACLQARLPM